MFPFVSVSGENNCMTHQTQTNLTKVTTTLLFWKDKPPCVIYSWVAISLLETEVNHSFCSILIKCVMDWKGFYTGDCNRSFAYRSLSTNELANELLLILHYKIKDEEIPQHKAE